MPKPTKPPVNPLLGANIPAAPLINGESPVEQEKSITVKGENGNLVKDQSSHLALVQPQKEKATIEISLYLQPDLDDKLDDLRKAYKKRTGKKISANEVMRRLIKHGTLEMLL